MPATVQVKANRWKDRISGAPPTRPRRNSAAAAALTDPAVSARPDGRLGPPRRHQVNQTADETRGR